MVLGANIGSNTAGLSGSLLAANDSDPPREAVGTSSLLSSGKASKLWIFGRLSFTRFRPYWPLHLTPDGDRSGLRGCHGHIEHLLFLSFRTSGSLDKPTPLLRHQLTSASRSGGLPTLSVSISGQTRQISRGKFLRLPRTTAEFTFYALDGYGLHCQLPARPTLTPHIRFLSVGSRVCYMLPSDAASRQSPLHFANPSPPSGWIRDFHPQTEKHARRTTKNPQVTRPEGWLNRIFHGRPQGR